MISATESSLLLMLAGQCPEQLILGLWKVGDFNVVNGLCIIIHFLLPCLVYRCSTIDITLFSTTLRYGASNELSTVSNGSIANARITNCARSKKAIVQLLFRFHIRFHEGDKLRDFREALDTYVLNNPNRWGSIVFFRCDEIDTDNEFVQYNLVIRSSQSWQPAPRVLEHRSQLNRFCQDLALKMEVSYNAPLPSSVLYSGGKMQDVTHPKVNRVREKSESMILSSQSALMTASSDTFTEPEESSVDEFERTPLERIATA